jgi:threonylcarbamoyladenosine tRNA methylthiotransferase MtaB
MNVFIKTMGCKVNHFDSSVLMSQFEDVGMKIVEKDDLADITVVNSCSVTAKADKEALYLARRLKAKNPQSLLVFTGCFAQTDSAALLDLNSIDLVIPNELKHETASRVHALSLLTADERAKFERFPSTAKSVEKNRQSHFKTSHVLFGRSQDKSRTRVFLKVQDGCNGFCTYCLIPYARGASRSVSELEIVEEVQRLESEGVREVVLTGIHVGDYGRDLDLGTKDLSESGYPIERQAFEHPFAGLMSLLFRSTAKMRFRISSLEPSELSQELIEVLYQNRTRFCDHLHLPLQSGNDRILRAMSRTYSKKQYEDSVGLVRKYFPKANIGADVIPGFPGETIEEHAETVEFIKSLQLAYLHVFPYSKRPNTAAGKMPDHVPLDVVAKRAKDLRNLSSQLKLSYSKSQVNREVEVLWQNETYHDGRLIGLSSNYLRVLPRAGKEILKIGDLQSLVLQGVVGEDDLLLGS